MKKIIFFLLFTGLIIYSAHSQTSIICSDTAFLFQGTIATSLYGVNLASGSHVLLQANLISATTNRIMNAFGYNRLDNYLWGYRYNTNQIARIGADPYTPTFFPINGLPSNKSFNVGDVDSSGILYLYLLGDTIIYRIDLNSQQLLPNVYTTASLISDWVFSPVDGNIYSVDSLHMVYRFHPSTGQRDSLGQTTGSGLSNTSPFGAQFMDSLGNLFISDNYTGEIFEIVAPHTGNITPILFSQGPASTTNDGAFCKGAIVTSVDNLSTGNNLSINLYPNPVAEELNVDAVTNDPLEIILYDLISGKLIQRKFKYAVSLNTQHLAKGIYLYEVRNKNGVVKKGKIVKD